MKSESLPLLFWAYCKKMLREAFHRTRHHATRLLGHAWAAAKFADRALGHAASIYPHVAPLLAPIATEHLGLERATHVHRALTNTFAARDRGH